MELARGIVIDRSWRLKELLGKGECGEVWDAEPMNTRENGNVPFVVKLAPLKDTSGNKRKKKGGKDPQDPRSMFLKAEYDMYRAVGALQSHAHLPILPLESFGWDHGSGYAWLVLERLGTDVQAVAIANGGGLSVGAGAAVMVDVLRALEHIHSCGCVVVDLKPQNLMLGLPDHGPGRVRVIDFGCASHAFDMDGVPAVGGDADTREVNGTPKYVARGCHHGAPASYGADLEGLGYVVASLLSYNRLPWADAKSMEMLSDMKDASTPRTIAASCGSEQGKRLIENFLSSIYSLKDYTDRSAIDYAALIGPWAEAADHSELQRASLSVQSPGRPDEEEEEEEKVSDDEQVESQPRSLNSKPSKRRKAGSKRPRSSTRKQSSSSSSPSATTSSSSSTQMKKKNPSRKKRDGVDPMLGSIVPSSESQLTPPKAKRAKTPSSSSKKSTKMTAIRRGTPVQDDDDEDVILVQMVVNGNSSSPSLSSPIQQKQK